MEPIHQSKMRGMESRALFYELPQMLGGLLLGAGLAVATAFVYSRYPHITVRTIEICFFAMIGLGLLCIFYAASFYPKRALVFADRIRFVMAFSHREIPLAEVESVRVLAPEEVRPTFFSLRFVSMSPCLSGAVELRRKRGRTWVFSPEDPEQLVERVRAAMTEARSKLDPTPEVKAPGEVLG